MSCKWTAPTPAPISRTDSPATEPPGPPRRPSISQAVVWSGPCRRYSSRSLRAELSPNSLPTAHAQPQPGGGGSWCSSPIRAQAKAEPSTPRSSSGTQHTRSGANFLAHELHVRDREQPDHHRHEGDDLRPDQDEALIERQDRGDLLLCLGDAANGRRRGDVPRH